MLIPDITTTAVKNYVEQNEIDSVVVLYSISNFTANGNNLFVLGAVRTLNHAPSTSRLPGLPPGSLARQGFSGGFFLLLLGAGLPKVYQGHFLREKPVGFSLFFAF